MDRILLPNSEGEVSTHMGTMLETIQNAIIPEPEPQVEAQPGTTQSDDTAVETQLTEEISNLWSDHVRLSTSRKVTSKELRQIRAALAERLHAMKCLLSRPGRGGQWRSWLRERGINRSTADRLVARHAETLCNHEGDAPSGAIPDPAMMTSEKLARVVWSRFGKFLVSAEVVIDFIGRIAELSGVGHEQRAEGFVIFVPAAKPADELPGSAPASGPLLQPFDEASAVTEEPPEKTAATPTVAGQAVADEGSGDAV